MDHQVPESLPSIELPKPERGGTAPDAQAPPAETYNETAAGQRIEQGVSAPTANPLMQAQAQGVPAGSVPIQDAPPAGVAGTAIAPQIADDSDLIEKEWVEKAKAIVEQTKHDPNLQTKEMTKIKAAYLKKRYNKDIKPSE